MQQEPTHLDTCREIYDQNNQQRSVLKKIAFFR